MKKARIILIIYLLFTTAMLLYTWTILLFTNAVIVWQHYTALALFIPIVYLYFKHFKLAIAGMAVYYLLGALSVFSLTRSISSFGFSFDENIFYIGNPLCWLLFIIYIIANLNNFIELYLDYKEWKNKP